MPIPTLDTPYSLRPGFHPRYALRDFGICIVGGVWVTLVIGLGNRSVLQPVEFLKSISLFLVNLLVAELMLRWLSRRLGEVSGPRRTAIQALVLFVASNVGYTLMVAGQMLVWYGRLVVPTPDYYGKMAIVGCMGIAFGLALYTYDHQRLRLAEGVARLKEAEFAERELHLARALQGRLLPSPEIEGEGYRISARNLAARVVAGDFYDVFPLAGGHLGLVVADVAGKGMAASLIMASVKAMLPLVAADRTPAEALRELNRRLAGELSPREFVALAYARFDPVDGIAVLANAGLPDPYRLAPGEGPETVSVPGPRLPLGVRKEVEYLATEVTLAPGERLLWLTDGLAEAPAASGEPLGYEALAGLVASSTTNPGRTGAPRSGDLDDLFERVRAATSATLEDDWTALLLERC